MRDGTDAFVMLEDENFLIAITNFYRIRRHGSRVDYYVGPAPDEVVPNLAVEKLVDKLVENTRLIVRRTGQPPTPAAEFFCDLVRRAVRQRDDLNAN